MKLYKYVTEERVDIISSGKIRFTQFFLFNDPFEAFPVFVNIPEKFDLSDLKKSLDSLNIGSQYRNQFFEKNFESKKYRDASIVKAATDTVNLVNSTKGFLSLSETNKSSLMWSHYANSHTGFCIEFDIGSLFKNSFFQNKKLMKVTYNKKREIDLSLLYSDQKNNFIDWWFNKEECWSYEKEWRVMSQLDEASLLLNNEENYLDPDLIALFSYPPSAITAIYLGARSSEALMRNIISIIYNNVEFKNTKVYKFDVGEDNYNYNIVEISRDKFNDEYTFVKNYTHSTPSTDRYRLSSSMVKTRLNIKDICPNILFESDGKTMINTIDNFIILDRHLSGDGYKNLSPHKKILLLDNMLTISRNIRGISALSRVLILSNMGVLYADIGDDISAESHLLPALNIAIEIKNYNQIEIISGMLGKILLRLDAYDASLYYFHLSLEQSALHTQNLSSTVETLIGLIDLSIKTEQWDVGRVHLSTLYDLEIMEQLDEETTRGLNSFEELLRKNE